MFTFKLEPEIPLLVVTRSGLWSRDTVILYETMLRRELEILQLAGRPTAFIIDIRSSPAQSRDVADALRLMVAGLGHLHADRTAVVTSSGIAKLEARYVADLNTQIFTSMVLARDWVTESTSGHSTANVEVHNQPSDAQAEGPTVHVQGPSSVDIVLTPAAALETAKRISNAAVEVFLTSASTKSLQRDTNRA